MIVPGSFKGGGDIDDEQKAGLAYFLIGMLVVPIFLGVICYIFT